MSDRVMPRLKYAVRIFMRLTLAHTRGTLRAFSPGPLGIEVDIVDS